MTMVYDNGVYYASSLLDLEDSNSYSYKFFKGSIRNNYYFKKKPINFTTIKEKLRIDDETIIVEVEFPVDEPSFVFIYNNGSIRQYYVPSDEENFSFKVVDNFKNWEDYDEIIWYYTYGNDKAKIISMHPNGMVKEISKNYYENWRHDEKCFFDNEGWPTRKERTKRGKLKEVLIFDKNSKEWTYLKKKDW